MPTVPSLPGLPDDYTSKFFQGDFVTKYIDGSYRGRVLRCWADDEDLPPEPLPRDHLNRPLLRGEVGIESLKDGALAIVPETSLVLYQREFMRGDIVKRSLFDTQSAIVQSMYSEVKLEHVMTKQKLKEWIPFQSLKSSLVVQHRDTVVFENWIGTIEEVYEQAIIELPDKSLVRITDMSGTMKPGMTHEEMIKRQHNCADPENCEFKPDMELKGGVVKFVRPIIIYVSWNAINQRLSPAEQETCKEPKKIWAGDEMEKLILFSRMRNAFPRDGRSVVFKDPNQESEYGFQPDPNDADGVRVFNVVGSRTKITLRWQNGTTTTDWASDLLPYYHVDDYESWPGEHLMWRGDNGEKRWAVVQKYDSVQRIADLKFMDNGELQTVSAMELDNGGLGMKEYGIGVGNMVLLSVCNHSAPPVVPMLGRYDSQMENMMRRDGLARMADEADRAGQQYLNQGPQGSADPINWFGYVKSLELDGKIVVTLANGEEEIVNLTQCHSISEWQPPEWEDVGGPMEPPYLDEMDTDPNDPDGVPFPRTESQQRLLDEEFGAIPPGLTDLLATLRNQPSAPLGPLVSNFLSTTADFDPWATSRPPADTQDEDEDEDDYEDEDVEMRDMDEINRIVDPDTQMEDQTKLTSAPDADEPDFPEAGPSSHRDTRASGSGGGGSRTWENFEVQEEAPEDHKYFSEPSIGAAGKSYHSRIAKEHKTLRTSLPDNIIVRTYENRTDLMRCLIIGPEGTPYADAPFVFDVYLKPGSYPTSPPQVHFHSHTHGKGRCNPNLYEEGKVCLSILGTWHGDSSESWSDKSSLLQVFVSISGLVLVRSPYHCEPAFAKLEGTKEGRVNSRLYSEKAYVLSRSFVKTALERPPGGLDDEIRDIYINEGRLQRVIDHAKPLMEQGEAARDKAGGEVPEEEVWNADAMGSLTMGAILSLKRTISRLEELWAERNDA